MQIIGAVSRRQGEEAPSCRTVGKEEQSFFNRLTRYIVFRSLKKCGAMI